MATAAAPLGLHALDAGSRPWWGNQGCGARQAGAAHLVELLATAAATLGRRALDVDGRPWSGRQGWSARQAGAVRLVELAASGCRRAEPAPSTRSSSR